MAAPTMSLRTSTVPVSRRRNVLRSPVDYGNQQDYTVTGEWDE